MKAIVVERPNELKMIDVPIPEVGAKDVLCKVRYSGICATDMAILEGSLFSGAGWHGAVSGSYRTRVVRCY